MSSIRSYQDLLKEKEQLQATLLFQKGLIRQDLEAIREELKPVVSVISTVGRITRATKNNPLVGLATTVASELLLGNLLLSRTSKATRMVVPFIAKKIFSVFLQQSGTSIFQKIAGVWKNRHRTNGVSAGR